MFAGRVVSTVMEASRASARNRRGAVQFAIALTVIVALGACGSNASGALPAHSRTTTTSSSSTTSIPPSSSTTTASPWGEVSTMTTRQLAAQMVVAGFQGTAPGDPTLAANLQDDIGGVLLFGDNITSGDQVAALNRSITCAASPIPPWISVDQEPGSVARLRGILASQPTPADLGAGIRSGRTEPAAVRQLGAAQGAGLDRLGFNMDLAPVVDVARPGSDDVIGDRSFGADAGTVSTLSAEYIDGLQSEGVAAVAKHFPGLGAVHADPHETIPTISISRDEWEHVDAAPFRAAIQRGVDGVMVTDVVMTALDGTNARESRTVVSGVLRGELGYDGLVVSDAIEMGLGGGGDQAPHSAVLSIDAGIDQVLVSDGASARRVIDGLNTAIESGVIPRTQAESIVRRIITTKRRVMAAAGAPSCARQP